MIDQTDRHLSEWVASVCGDTTISLTPPKDAATGRGISLYLLELAPMPPAGSTRRLPLQLSLRYLVTTWADKPEDGHRLLGDLVFAAMENAELEVELEPVPVTVWNALGVLPRPSFVLRVPLRLERPEPATKLVRKPLVVQTVPLSTLEGVVLTPDGVPLVGAYVELTGMHLSERTDSNGRFRFGAVPGEPPTKLLSVRAKGQERRFTIEQTTATREPVTIRFDLREG